MILQIGIRKREAGGWLVDAYSPELSVSWTAAVARTRARLPVVLARVAAQAARAIVTEHKLP